MKKLSILASAVAMTASSLFGDIAIGKGLSASGYIDIYYESVSTDVPAGAADTSGFNAAVAEIDFAFDFGNGLSATVDLEGNVADDGGNGVEIEQARIDYAFGDSSITIGKFDTPIGLEALESPDLYQYSVSLTTDLQYTQHTGIMYGFDNGFFNLNVGVVNALAEDNANGGASSNDELSYFAKVGITPTDALAVNAAFSGGDEADPDTTDAIVAAGEHSQFSVDASWSDFGWTVGAEYLAQEVDYNGTETETDAFMIMANYMFTEQFGLTLRASQSEVDGGDESTEFTISPGYAITPNWFVLAEYRMDETENNAGTTTAESDTIAVETILTF